MTDILRQLFLTSAPKGIAWPETMSPLATATYQLIEYFEKSQWFTPEKLRLLQATQLLNLVHYSYEKIPFYRERLNTFSHIKKPDELLEQWLSLPLLTRQQLQQAGTSIQNTKEVDHGKINTMSTSGSTGRPVSILTNSLLQFYINAFNLRDHLWHNRDLSKTMAIIEEISDPRAIPPDGIKLRSWAQEYIGMINTGPAYAMGLCHPRDQLEWLNKINPDYLLCYPTILRGILEEAIKSEAINLTNLVHIRTFGEIVEPSLRKLTQQVLNVPIIDIYSSTEFGIIAIECPTSKNYHVQAEGVLVEILNDSNLPCLPGEIGKVVITSLHNFSSPLIRYEIGDYAEVSKEACSCGRGLPTLSKILGRHRNMLVLPNGEKRWPSFTGNDNNNLFSLFSLQQFQIIQSSLYDIVIKIAAPNGCINEDTALSVLKNLFSEELNYRFEYVEHIPRHKTGKYEDFVSLVV